MVFDDEFTHFHSWGKAKYPQIGQILCNTAHKLVHQIILTSRILNSLHILRKIPGKLQLSCWELHEKIIGIFTHCFSMCNKYNKVWSARESQYLKCLIIQFTRDFKTHKIEIKFILLNKVPTCLVGRHLARDKRSQKLLRWLIYNQMVSGDLQTWIIKPNKNMLYFLNL